MFHGRLVVVVVVVVRGVVVVVVVVRVVVGTFQPPDGLLDGVADGTYGLLSESVYNSTENCLLRQENTQENNQKRKI